MPDVKTIYFDEAGFTGYNLLDKDQPFFTVASTDLLPKESEEILKTAFPRYQGKEFKFSNIWNSANRRGLITLAELLKEKTNHFYIFTIDKKFAVFAQIVDWLIEPLLTDGDFDFYAEKYSIKLANHIYYGILLIMKDDQLIPQLITIYQQFSRYPSMENLDALKSFLRGCKEKATDDVMQTYFDMMHTGAATLPDQTDIETFDKTNDLQLSSMLANIYWWRGTSEDDFIVEHDDTANFNRQRNKWDKITSPDVVPFVHRINSGGPVHFPIRVLKTTSVNSKDNFSIQLCDIIAGFANRIHMDNEAENNLLLQQCLAIGLENIANGIIRPEPSFPEPDLPRRHTGEDAIDAIAKLLED